MKVIWGFVVCGLLTCGCAQWKWPGGNLQGEGFKDNDKSFTKLGQRLRPEADIPATGMSAKAREIEENLGAR